MTLDNEMDVFNSFIVQRHYDSFARSTTTKKNQANYCEHPSIIIYIYSCHLDFYFFKT